MELNLYDKNWLKSKKCAIKIGYNHLIYLINNNNYYYKFLKLMDKKIKFVLLIIVLLNLSDQFQNFTT